MNATKPSRILSVCFEAEKACFTNPSIPVESMSYDVPTPQACKGMLEAIYWKPEFAYIVESVEVCSPIKKRTMMINGVKTKANLLSPKGYYYPDNKKHQKRITYLISPRYRVNFRIVLVSPPDKSNNTLKKHIDILMRRTESGSPFKTVYMGMSDVGCYASIYPDRDWKPIPETRSLGVLLYGFDYSKKKDGVAPRHFFHASIEDGVVRFPSFDEVCKG